MTDTASTRKILPEIHQSRQEARTTPTPFPAACPACGGRATTATGNVSVAEYNRAAVYECGAAYTYKSQIQNHTEKWWGVCPAGGSN